MITIPDACHVKRAHAQDIAETVRHWLKVKPWCACRVFLSPAGHVWISTGDETCVDGASLVGTYTVGASAEQIADDIIAAQREPMGGDR